MITAADIKYRLATTAGAAGNTTAQGNPNASLGKYMSTTDLNNAASLNLFDKVTGDENLAADVEYRCLFVLNDHATLTWETVMAWISAETAGGAGIDIGLDPTGVTAKGSAGAQALTVATEQDAPAGVAFSHPLSKATGLPRGDVPAGSCFAVWFRRTAANSAPIDVDGAILATEGDTAA